MLRTIPLVLILGLVGPGCASTSRPGTEGADVDLGSHTRTVTTSSPVAQRWFDRGLTWLYAFNHDEAIRCFSEAAEIDPGCAMAWWGIACANGPHINNPMVPPERDGFAREAVRRASTLVTGGTPVERALVAAQAQRWGASLPADRRPLDEAYSQAMDAVAREFPDDADVAALTAEAAMDLQPWDLWTRAGAPKGRAIEILAQLERALALDPNNPLANHLYVHATEASSRPELGLAAADRLRDLAPDAGHLVHMPAHTYLRTARLADASRANELAMAADRRHRAEFPRDGFYRVYMAHNAHFLTFSSMLEGRCEAALQSARTMLAEMPPEFVQAAGPLVDGFMPVVMHTLVRFGRWQEVLEHPPFPAEYPVANGVRHYARGTALNALGKPDEAEAELRQLDALVAALDERTIGNNPAQVVMKIPQLLLSGEIAFSRGRRDEGLARVAEAVAIEDQLVYDEPPDWMMPVRHPYGAMLLEAERWKEAERAFHEDLTQYPENGWSLFGLARALRAQGREGEARAAESRFRTAWARADTKIHAPCLCQPGRGPAVLAAR